MAWIRGILIAAALVLGLVGSLTAYVVPLRLQDPQLIGLTLNAEAGNAAAPGEKPRAILAKDTTLTSENLRVLRDAGVERVKVKEFSFRRWTGLWMFMLGALAFIGAAVLGRVTARPAAVVMEGGVPTSPAAMLEAAEREMRELSTALPGAGSEAARLLMLRERVDAALQSHMAGIVASRPALIGTMGIGGYARFMEVFAAAERALNRAWSAAADSHEEEAMTSLARAQVLLGEARGRLR